MKKTFDSFFEDLRKIMEEVFSLDEEKPKKEERPQPKFVGVFGIKYIIVNEPKKKVSIHWEDGEITKAICNEEDTFDKYAGFALAFTKRYFKSSNAFKEFIDFYGFNVPQNEKKEEK